MKGSGCQENIWQRKWTCFQSSEPVPWGGVMFELRSAGRVRDTLLSVPPGVPNSRDRATCNGPLQGEQAVSGKLKEDQCSWSSEGGG